MWIQVISNRQTALTMPRSGKQRPALFGRKRSRYSEQLSSPVRRLGKHPNANTYMWRRIILVIAVIVTLAFTAKLTLDFFNAEYVSLEISGNIHYTDIQIYDVLGDQLENIVTDSEEQTADYLKKRLSYIKEARIIKHVMKRILTIEVTEREPFALLQFRHPDQTFQGDTGPFFLIDSEGHVLEGVAPAAFEDMVILQTVGDKPPQRSRPVQGSDITLGLTVLKAVRLHEPELAAVLKTVDASDPQKIEIQIESVPLPIWIAGDAIESGLHYIALLLKQHSARLLDYLRERTSESHEAELYLDARFQDTLYLGGYTESGTPYPTQ